MGITEEILKKRLQSPNSGSIFPQIFVSLTMSLGAFVYGNTIGWSYPATKHLKTMVANYEERYPWTVTIAPLAGATGILPWYFFSRRLGPKKTLILQTPFNILSWFILAYYNKIEVYNIARFFTAFFCATYYQCGENLLLESVHRRYLKIMFAFHRTALFTGVLVMNALGPKLEKHFLCIFCSSIIFLISILLIWLPESPVHLMRSNLITAQKSLMWYRGNKMNNAELEVMSQYINFQKNQAQGFISMYKAKAVIKAMFIVAFLIFIKIGSGYYAFLIDNPKWFTAEFSCIGPHTDNIILSSVMALARFFFTIFHLYTPFGVRKPLLVSCLATAILLTVLGYYKFIIQNILSTKKHNSCVTLPMLCVYILAYESGLSLCPEICIYEYLPFQVYDTIKLLLLTMQWFMVFIVTRLYIVMMQSYHSYLILWILAINMFIGYAFVMVFVIESRGKELMTVQIELGGNPIGTRGSRRQRIATPMDDIDTDAQLKELINKHYIQQNEP